ncbi:hypothetical protein [Sulfurimonas sp.]|nr:hypothetical protein [Sulfurimonas sp.]
MSKYSTSIAAVSALDSNSSSSFFFVLHNVESGFLAVSLLTRL